MNKTLKKSLALFVTLVMIACLAPATWIMANATEAPVVNKADFETVVTDNPNGDSSYSKTHTTTNGWTTENSAIQCGGAAVANPQFPVIGPDNTYKAVCMNGKVSAPGKITSPTLTDGVSKITVNYTKMFTDTQLAATITVTDVATGTTYSQSFSKEAEKDDKYTVWTFEWVLETPVTGDFTIEVVNDSPSGASGNKDRLTVLELAWESAPEAAPEVPTSATISFADAANRTYQDTEQQVWQQNGITVTNNKADSTSDVRDYVNPMRIYAHSSVTIEYPGMTKLEITCPTKGYAEALIAGVTAAYADADASFELTDPENNNANTIVTIILAEAADSITFSVEKQTRFREMTVYGQGGGETPAPGCQHTNTTVEGAMDATCTAEGFTGNTVCVDCGEIVSEGELIGALGHNEVTDEGKEATCTEVGLTEGKHCDRCGEILVVQEEITAVGHADANQDGLCDNCGVQCGEPVPPTGDNGMLLAILPILLMSAVAAVLTLKKRQMA